MMEAMDHSEVREILEDAAIEPLGLERLMAGDTPTASIVAGHLAGCPDCAEELARLHRSVALIQPTVRAVPPPELRERTLAFVAAVGRPRGAAGARPHADDEAGAPRPEATDPHVPDGTSPVAPSSVVVLPRRAGPGRLGWVAALAAAIVVAVSGTTLLSNASHEATTRALTAEVEALGDVARWTLRVDAQPDVRRIALASATSTPVTGTLVFSPTSTELVVVAEGLPAAAAGHEYKCWVEVGGGRASIGKMFFGGGIAYWVGEVPEVAGLPADARFGVTLVDLATPGDPARDVLVSAD